MYIYIYIYFQSRTNCCLIYWTTENEEGVIYKEDSEDDGDYVWTDHFEHAEDGSSGETKERVVGDEYSPIFDEPDPYDYVYSNMPDDVHVLKPVDDCKHVVLRGFNMRRKVSVVVMDRQSDGMCACRGVPEEGVASRPFSSYYGAKV
jgi:hypothetical protein